MVRADLRSSDGQVLGYPWLGVVDNWHRSAFTSFGDGHGVWEKDGGATLPFYSRNFQGVRLYKQKFKPDWLPRYMAYAGAWEWPVALANVSALIAGSWTGTVLPRRDRDDT